MAPAPVLLILPVVFGVIYLWVPVSRARQFILFMLLGAWFGTGFAVILGGGAPDEPDVATAGTPEQRDSTRAITPYFILGGSLAGAALALFIGNGPAEPLS